MQLSRSVAGNSQLRGVSLNFQARSIIVDNPTGTWWYIPDNNLYIQPYTMGNVVSIEPTQVGELINQAPDGRTSTPSGAETAYITWFDRPATQQNGTAIPDAFTYNMVITSSTVTFNVAIVSSSVTLDVRITGSTVTLSINIASSAIVLSINIASSAITLQVNLLSSSITLNVNIQSSSITVNVAIVSSSVTINVSLVASSATVNINLVSSAISLSVTIASSLATIDVRLTASLITLNINITSQSVNLDIRIVGSTVTLNINIVSSAVTLSVAIASSVAVIDIRLVSQTINLDIRIVGSTVTLNVAIASSAVTLNVNIAASAATVSINLAASAITLAISAVTLPWDTVSENLLENPSFETGNTNGWTNIGLTGAFVASTLNPHGGTYSLRSSPAAGGGSGEARNNAIILCTPGQKLEAQCWMTTDANVVNAQVQIAFWSYSGVLTGTALSPAVAGATAYTARRAVGIAPNGTYYATVGLIQTNGALFGITFTDEWTVVRHTAVTLGQAALSEQAALRNTQVLANGGTALLAVGAGAVGPTYTVAAGRIYLVKDVTFGQGTAFAVAPAGNTILAQLRVGGVVVKQASGVGGGVIPLEVSLPVASGVVVDLNLINLGSNAACGLGGTIAGYLL